MAKLADIKRHDALKQFVMADYPTAKAHGWRHIRLRDYADAHFNLQVPTYTVEGLTVVDQGQVIAAVSDQLHYLAQPISTMHKLRLLHEAYWHTGLFISIPADYRLSRPLIITISGDGPGTFLPHVVIEMGAGSSASIIEKYQFKKQANCVVSGVTSVQSGKNAKLEMVTNMRSQKNIDQFYSVNMLVDTSATIVHMPILYGSGLSRMEVAVTLQGTDARAHLRGVALSKDDAQLIYETKQIHAASNTESDLEYRAVLSDSSNAFFKGLIRIEKNAQKSNAYQKNLNVMLGSNAKVHTTPELEIQANDVRCTHGATSGPLNAEQMFYARARGMSEKQARVLLAESFAQAHISPFSDKHLATYATKVISQEVRKVAR